MWAVEIMTRGRGVAAACALALLAGAAGGQERGSSADALARAERTIDRQLTMELEQAPTFLAYKELHPVEYRRLVAKLAEGGFDGDISNDDIAGALAELNAIRAKYAPAFADAPNAEMVAFLESRLAAMRVARSESPALCDAVANDIFGIDLKANSRRTREAFTEVELAYMRAAKAGFDRPLQRGEPSEDELNALAQEFVRRGASRRTIDQLLGDRETASPRESCNNAILLYEAISALPARSAAAIMTSMIRAEARAVAGAVGPGGLTPEEAAFERLLAREGLAAHFAVLKDEFPEEYGKARSGYITDLKDGGAFEDVVDDLTSRIVLLQVTYTDEIALAGDRELADLLTARNAVLKRARAEEPAFCADFAENYVYEFPDDASDELNDAVLAFDAALLKAIASGMNRPVRRAALDEGDMQDLLVRLGRTGVSEADLEHFLTGELDALPVRGRCDMALALGEAIAAMPPKAAAALTGRMMSQLADRDESLADVRKQLASEPPADSAESVDASAFLVPLKASFPADYAALAQILDEEATGRGADTRLKRMADTVERWTSANASHLARSPDAELFLFTVAYRDFMTALQRIDAAACAAAGETAPRLDGVAGNPQYIEVLAAFAKAAAAGRDRPVSARTITEADKEALVREGLRLGITDADLDETRKKTTAEECRFQLRSYEAVAALPTATAARLMSLSGPDLFAGNE